MIDDEFFLLSILMNDETTEESRGGMEWDGFFHCSFFVFDIIACVD